MRKPLIALGRVVADDGVSVQCRKRGANVVFTETVRMIAHSCETRFRELGAAFMDLQQLA